MSEQLPGVMELLAGRLPSGLVLGLALGLLMALVGLLRPRGALAAAGWLALATVAGSWPTVGLLATTTALTGLAARLIGLAAHRDSRKSPTAGALVVTAACAGATLAAAAGSIGAYGGLGLAASCGAAAASVATWCGILVTSGLPAQRYHPLLLRSCNATPGLSGAGLAAATAAIALAVATANELAVIGPGDGALVAIAALGGVLVACVPTAARGDAIAARMLLASALGALGAGLLAALIP